MNQLAKTRSAAKAEKPEEISQEVYDLFDDYVHDRIDRRGFLSKASAMPLAGFTALSVLDYLSPQYAGAAQIDPDDKRVKSAYLEYNSPNGGGTMRGLFCTPADMTSPRPAVLVVHENRGLNPYIEDVARRVAVAGYVALAPDALWPLGGYPGNDDDGRNMQKQRDRNKVLEDFLAAFDLLKTHKNCNGKVGVVGFCFGGWVSNMLTVKRSNLDAAVPYYGGQPDISEIEKINAPILMQFAENDGWVNEGWPAYEAALKAQKKSYQAYTYPGTQHGFHNDTTPRFDEKAASLSWQRTLDFFDKHLK